MALTSLRDRLAQPEPFFFGWCSLPGVLHADAMARLPFEGICIDMQHGLMDFGDVVVHVFQDEARNLYDIEGLWMDARRIPVPAGREENA